ncbi:AMP-binding protein [Streptomyces omiyaensis]|uniref:AMP-binding protein n=1 Tax=Streptomyces omiyaensis TaxID=68247 RepID=UPI0036F710F1
MLDGVTPWPEEFVDRYWAAGYWRGNTLDDLLRGRALEHGARTALAGGGERLTYARLNRWVDRMAAGFLLRGVAPRQRVVVRLPDVPEFVVGLFALMRAGAVPVVCPVGYPTEGVERLVRLTEAAGYVGLSSYEGEDRRAAAEGIAARSPFLRRVFTLDAPGGASPYGGLAADSSGCLYFPLGAVDGPPGPVPPRSSADVTLLLPSARPGEPLLVPRTHDDYAHQARAAAAAVSLGEDDVLLAVSPAGSPLALGCPGVVGALAVGGTVVLGDGNGGAGAEGPVTVVAGGDGGGGRGGRARLVQVAHAGPGCDGAQRVVALAERVVLLDGRPLTPDDEFRVAGPDGADAPEGELLARGPSVPRGYYRAPDANARAFAPDGFLRTGLRARRAADGRLIVNQG